MCRITPRRLPRGQVTPVSAPASQQRVRSHGLPRGPRAGSSLRPARRFKSATREIRCVEQERLICEEARAKVRAALHAVPHTSTHTWLAASALGQHAASRAASGPLCPSAPVQGLSHEWKAYRSSRSHRRSSALLRAPSLHSAASCESCKSSKSHSSHAG